MKKSSKVENSITLWHQFLQCYKSVERNIATNLQSNYQQSLSRYDVLRQLAESPEKELQVGELTKRLLDTAGSVSALLTRMENEELVIRRLNPNDRRSFQISITDKGRKLYRAMASDYAIWVASAMEEISGQEREVLLQLLQRLKKAQNQVTKVAG